MQLQAGHNHGKAVLGKRVSRTAWRAHDRSLLLGLNEVEQYVMRNPDTFKCGSWLALGVERQYRTRGPGRLTKEGYKWDSWLPRFGKGEDFLKQLGNRRDPQMNPSIVRTRARVWGCSVRKLVNELTHGQEFRTRSTSSKGDTKSGLDMEGKSRPRV